MNGMLLFIAENMELVARTVLKGEGAEKVAVSDFTPPRTTSHPQYPCEF